MQKENCSLLFHPTTSQPKMKTVEPVPNGSWWMKEVRGRILSDCVLNTTSAVYSEEREQGRQESHNHEDKDHTKPNSMENEKYIESNAHTPRWLCGKRSACQCRRCRRHEFDPWVRMIPWRRKWQPTPAFFPGKFHGQRSLVGYSPWGHKKSDFVTEL